MYKDVNSKQQIEINTDKQELYSSHNENSVLKTRIFNLEDYSRDLNRQYSDYINAKNKQRFVTNNDSNDSNESNTTNQNDTINNDTAQDDNENLNKQNNLRIKRGLGKSKR